MSPADPLAAQSLSRRPSAAEAAKLTARVTWISVSVGGLLLGLKAAIWWFSGSVALLASAADSGLDFLAALGTFWAVRIAVKPADAEHRFGHGKAEAFASLLQAALVFASAALIGQQAVTHLLRPQVVGDEGWAIGVMLVSVGLTLALIRAQDQVIRQTRSIAITGDRAHYMADLVSNAAAILGIGVAWATRAPVWDALAGLVVAAWLVRGAVIVLHGSASELLDREVDEEERQHILSLALDDVQVLGVHQFRTRAAGPLLHVQMHMELEPEQSLHHAHQVVEAAERRILSAYPAADLVIHADPYGLSEDHDQDFDGFHAASRRAPSI